MVRRMPQECSLIVARDLNGAIGKDGKLPWRLAEDMKFFRDITRRKTIVMGRKTHESIGRTLPDRRNLVLTRNTEFSPFEGAEAIPDLNAIPDGSVIIGGSEVYRQCLPLCNTAFITIVDTVIENADSFFDPSNERWVDLSFLFSHPADEHNDHAFSVIALTR